MRIDSSKRPEDNERFGGLTLKLDDYGIRFWTAPKLMSDKLRQALLDCEQTILRLGEPTHNYPDDTITGRMNYYNLINDEETWHEVGLPYIKEIIGEYLKLQAGEEVAIKAWGNILRENRKVYPHLHFGVPDDYLENPQSVCGNIFLGADCETATTYILDGEKVDIPNKYGQFTLFPPNLSHAVRTYTGSGVRVSAAFDVLVKSRDAGASVTGDKRWLTYTQPQYAQSWFNAQSP